MQGTGHEFAIEVLRYRLLAIAEEMTVVLRRTAFSPIIYDRMDFACALFDSDGRLLAQGRSMPLFLGTLGFAVGSARAAYPNEELALGDVIFMTSGFHHGTHTNDATLVVPAWVAGEVAGFVAVKAHFADVGAKDAFAIDSTDVLQEGALFPPVRIYRAGRLDGDLYRTLLANTRMPELVAGDLRAQVGAARAGAEGLAAIVQGLGQEYFRDLTAGLFDHGERLVRAFYAGIPDGVYTADGGLDGDGGAEVRFSVRLTVGGSDLLVELPNAPRQQAGPANSPWATVAGAIRFALVAPTFDGTPLNDGSFRPIEISTVPGTMFEPEWPAPLMLYAAPATQLIDTLHRALAGAIDGVVPAGSAGDFCGLTWAGRRQGGHAYWSMSAGQSNVGQGADWEGDGATGLSIPVVAGVKTAPVEVIEVRYPVRVERKEIATDSGGQGRHRGGLGVDVDLRALEDAELMARFERTRRPSWGLMGGGSGRPNRIAVHLPDGSTLEQGRFRMDVPAGTLVEIRTGGGGGYGDPGRRDLDAVREDVADGYVSEAAARRAHPDAFPHPAPEA